jgi:hypothetical protein
MEKAKTSILEFQGDSPRWAALKSFVTSTTLWSAGFIAFDAALGRVTDKNFFKNNHFPYSSKLMFGITSVLAVGNGLLDARNAYKKASSVQDQHTKLVADNIAMRAQLNQTGQILRHVADEVGKGALADSSLTLDESKTPPSHVAKLEAAKAAAEAQAALGKI